MNQFVDALGKACPMPVILAKKEIDAGNTSFVVAVDNEVAVENLKRLAESQNYQASVETKDGNFHVTFVGDGAAAPVCEESNKPKNWALFVGKDFIGDGSEELGNSLMTMFFYALAESNDAPRYILFMNSGVKLPVENDQVVEHLKTLQEKGSEILVCGTCLKFFNIADNLKIGTVSNMYDISERMHMADKVITL
ncbi:MAG: sulfurtransferase-like selenium metabolism protein YedF [Clostridium sp.]|nr:sulfurtransferase-like selenium metabolism protein YedF [Clostridium sp.]